MYVVLLCGGQGKRLYPHTKDIPKALIEIGGKPILWHLMKTYAHYGYDDFILCTGYHGDAIKKYVKQLDSTWNVKVVNTGLKSTKSERLLKIKKHINSTFLVNYSDGLSDVDIANIVKFHQSHSPIATLLAVRPTYPFGHLNMINEQVTSFDEKPQLDIWTNGGFFVFEEKVFDYLKKGTDLEECTLKKLADIGELNAYRHRTFWGTLNTEKDLEHLNALWAEGAPWKVWTF